MPTPQRPRPPTLLLPATIATLLPLLLLLVLLLTSLAPPATAAPAPSTAAPQTLCSLRFTPTTLHITCRGPTPVTLDASSPLLANHSIVPKGRILLTRTPSATPTTPTPPPCGKLTAPQGALLVLCTQSANLHLIDSTITSVRTTPTPTSPPVPGPPPLNLGSTPAPTDSSVPEGLLGARAALAILLAPPAPTAPAPSTLTITNLTAKGVRGGPPLFVALGANTVLRLANSTFADNRAPRSSGGGLALQLQPDQQPGAPHTVATLSGVAFINNLAFSGGGLSLQPTAAWAVPAAGVQTVPTGLGVVVERSRFEGNRAVFGGGVYAFDSNLTVEESVLSNNTAMWYGGGAGLESMQAFLLRNSRVAGNRAGHYGGGMFGAGGVGNTFNTMTVVGCSISDNLSERQGGGIFLQRGSTSIVDTTITNNTARQHGGGIAFLNLCDGSIASNGLPPPSDDNPPTIATASTDPSPQAAPLEASCSLQLTGTTRVLNNSALSAGGGLYVSVAGSSGVKLTQANAVIPAAENSAPYSPGISALPGMPQGITVNNNTFNVSSSTGRAGVIPLVASIGQYPSSVLADTNTQIALQFCDNKYLATPDPQAVAKAASHLQRDAPFLLRNFNKTRPAAGGNLGVVNFTEGQLRLLSGAVGRSYCLRVYAPDYPDVPTQTVTVTVAGCMPGEVQWAAAGCLPCSNLTYSFDPLSPTCQLCDPNAICDGGSVLVPKKGFWHSAFNSSDIQPCPNRQACQADRKPLQACQAAGSCTASRSAYAALQCTKGYIGNLCGNCDRRGGYGQALYFQCSACMPRAVSVLLAFALGAFALVLVIFVARKSLAEAENTETTKSSVVLVMDDFGGSWKAARPKQRRRDAPPQGGRSRGLGADAGAGGGGGGGGGEEGGDEPLPLRGGLPLPSLPAAVNHELADMVRKLELSDVFKVLMLHLQYLSIVSNLLIEWPRALRVILGLPRLLFFSSSSEIVSWECLGLGNGAMMALPILLPLLLVLVACGATAGVHTRALPWLAGRGWRRGARGALAAGLPTSRKHADANGNSAGTPSSARGAAAAAAAAGVGAAAGARGNGNGHANDAAVSDVARVDFAASGAAGKGYSGGRDLNGDRAGGRSRRLSSSGNSCSSTLDRVVATWIVGVFIFYFVLVSTSLSAFSCIAVDKDLYWIKDMSVRCGSSGHLRAALATGLLGVLVFCLLVPVGTIWWLARNRRGLGNASFKRRYGFLYRLYRPRYCFWEGIVCLQTMILVAITLFARGSSTYFQLVLLSGVLVLNYTLVSVLRPFRCRPLQWLYVASTVILLSTSLGAQLVWHGNTYMREVTTASGPIATVLMLAVMVANVMYVLVCLYIMGRTAAKIAQKSLVTAATWVAHATSQRPPMSKVSGPWRSKRAAEPACVQQQQQQQQPPQPLVWPDPDAVGAQENDELPLRSKDDPGSASGRRGAPGWGAGEGVSGRMMSLVVESSGGGRWRLHDRQEVFLPSP